MSRALLNYFSGADLHDDGDAAFERSRAEYLRRRLRLYIAIAAGLACLRSIANLDAHEKAHLIEIGLEICLLVYAWFYTKPGATGSSPRHGGRTAAQLARFTIGLVAANTILALAANRLVPGDADTGLMTHLFRHLVAALVLPWTWREAMLAAGVITGGNVALCIIDTATGASILRPVFALAFAPAMSVPGVLFSWYRHSQLRQRFHLARDAAGYRTLSRELESARRVHDASLPAPLPRGPLELHYVYHPFRHIGGDLLFVHPRRPAPGEPITLVVLDVAGHGIAAALTVNRIVGELERLLARRNTDAAGTPPTPSPGALARGLNRYVRLTLAPHGLFATAFIARIDPALDRLTWVNCGHPPGYIISPAGTLRRLDGDTFMLGVADEDELNAVEQVELFDVGSVVLALTDGATEARRPDGTCLLTAGFERLVTGVVADRANVPPRDWPAAISRQLRQHRNGLGGTDEAMADVQADDDTLLVAVVRTDHAADPVSAQMSEAASTHRSDPATLRP